MAFESNLDTGAETRYQRSVRSSAETLPDDSPAPARSRIRVLLEYSLPPIAMMLVLIGAWIGLIRWKHTSPLLAPSPGDVINGFRDNSSDILIALRSTFLDATLGLGLSITVGVLVAVIMSQSRLLERAIYPYTTLAQTIPIFAVAPLIGSIVGAGHTPIIMVSFIIAVFPMIANSTLGLTSVDPNHINLFKMYNASRLQELRFLRLPFALPYIMTGIRVSSGLAIVGAIVGEVLLGNGGPDGGGLGYEIWYAANQGLWGLLGAAALAAGILGIVVFVAIGAINSAALQHWHESAVEPEN